MKDFIPHPEALELKQLGFDKPCFGVYATKDGYVRKSAYDENGDAPTYSQAFRFFREKFNCHHTINLNKKYVGIAYSSVVNFSIDEFNTYEEAELACLKKLIELVKPQTI